MVRPRQQVNLFWYLSKKNGSLTVISQRTRQSLPHTSTSGSKIMNTHDLLLLVHLLSEWSASLHLPVHSICVVSDGFKK